MGKEASFELSAVPNHGLSPRAATHRETVCIEVGKIEVDIVQ